MAEKNSSGIHVVAGLRGMAGGRPRLLLDQDLAIDMLNVDLYRSTFARRRGGLLALATSGGTAMTTGIWAMGVYAPTVSVTATELWMTDMASVAVTKRRAAGVWANVTFDDAIDTNAYVTGDEVCFQSFNRKMFAAYPSAVNRLHCYDATDSTPRMRRSGLATPAAPTTSVAAGALTTTRKYRVEWVVVSGGIVIRRSNLSAASALQAAVAQNITINRPTLGLEAATHWQIYAYDINDNYAMGYYIAQVAVGTATFVDSSVALGGVAPSSDEGANTPLPSCKYLVADDKRLVLVGAYETTAGDSIEMKDNMIAWTPALGASNVGDDERLSNTTNIKGYDFINESITGVSQPLQGTFRVFSMRAQWKFVATGLDDSPYTRFRVTGGAGCISHKSIVAAVDESGQPCMYWLSKDGPMRDGGHGQERMVNDIQNWWDITNPSTSPGKAHAVYHEQKQQIWFFVGCDGTTLTANYPKMCLVFDTTKGRSTGGGTSGGWTRFLFESGTRVTCSQMWSSDPTTLESKEKPYLGTLEPTELYIADQDSIEDDAVKFLSTVELAPIAPWGPGFKGILTEPPTMAGYFPNNYASFDFSTYCNESLMQTTSVEMQIGATETARAYRKVEALGVEADTYSFKISTPNMVQGLPSHWNLDMLTVPWSIAGSR